MCCCPGSATPGRWRSWPSVALAYRPEGDDVFIERVRDAVPLVRAQLDRETDDLLTHTPWVAAGR